MNNCQIYQPSEGQVLDFNLIKKLLEYYSQLVLLYNSWITKLTRICTLDNLRYSPASEWIFIQISAGEKIMISNDSLGSKE